MTGENALYRLAAQAGIETGFRDAWGQKQDIAPETIEALLHCLGLGIGGASDIDARLRELAAAPWTGLIPPVAVIPAEAAQALIPLNAEADASEAVVEWQIARDDGETLSGRLRLADAPASGAAEIDGRRLVRRTLTLPALPMGYHTLDARLGAREERATLIVAPAACHLPDQLQGKSRVWGLATQLYSLRSSRNWGIGDFADLAKLAEAIAGDGAATVGVNPLHALFAAEPHHISPYSPSSRLFLNELYIAPEAVPEFHDCAPARELAAASATRQRRDAAREAELIDHAAVAALKRPIFEQLYRCFRERHLGKEAGGALTQRGRDFRDFQRLGGRRLRDFAIFEVLHETLLAAGDGFSWKDWPLPMREPDSPEVAAFAVARRDRVELAEYLQWEADRQLGEAAQRGRTAGLSIGLYRDLAVGVDPSGSEAWSEQDLLVPGAAIGAPPDLLNLKGQNWGLVPMSPLELKRQAYAPFIASLRANMRHAGALRIDHVMSLQHLYWVPRGFSAAAGAYVTYPFEDLLRILALESRRHRCAVIGEDLGTVPEGFRERMREAEVLSYRVLVFERQRDGSFTPPDQYPELAAASVATHDLATLKGFWDANDIAWRRRLDLYPTRAQRDADPENRDRERRQLTQALIREGVLSTEAVQTLLAPGVSDAAYRLLVEAAHRYLALSNARLALVQIEDATGELEQANLPGTIDEHPNWRRKLLRPLEEILADPAFRALAAAINEARATSSRRTEAGSADAEPL